MPYAHRRMHDADSHVMETGRNPIKRFEESMGSLSEPHKQRFYVGNFADLMGNGLPQSADTTQSRMRSISAR